MVIEFSVPRDGRVAIMRNHKSREKTKHTALVINYITMLPQHRYSWVEFMPIVVGATGDRVVCSETVMAIKRLGIDGLVL